MITSAEEFARLRRSDSNAEQMRAGSEEASLEVWADVVARFPDLRQWVAHNKTVPVQILEQLSNDPNANVRCAVAEKRKLTPALRSALARDNDASVRARIAYNAKYEAKLLHVLAADPEEFVREAALKALSDRSNAA